MDIFSTELEIRLSFVKTSEFREGGLNPPPQPPRYANASLERRQKQRRGCVRQTN
jgi:hypothetical protein